MVALGGADSDVLSDGTPSTDTGALSTNSVLEILRATPGFQFQLEEGLNAVETSAAASGGLFSGQAAKALQERGDSLAQLRFDTSLAQLLQTSGIGQASAAGVGAAAIGTAGTSANLLANATGQAGALNVAGAGATASGLAGAANSINRNIENSFLSGIGKIRAASVRHRIPLITTLTEAQAAVEAIRAIREGDLSVAALQDYFATASGGGE